MNCKDCLHKQILTRYGNTTSSVFCKHPDQEYIERYFKTARIHKMPSFIGFINSKGVFPIKKYPKWCPLCKEYREGGNG